ncbi:hypothetical protein ACFXAS_14490 [Streptomyces sp. NPDC059459]|uniref:hypothetical protein n=1 Tax=Streptomyces sp. NPDC059459 TaxID=3346839 RepID=UPI00369D3865
MRIVMQPAGLARKVVNRHFQDTIVKPVKFDEHTDLLEPGVREELKRLFPDGTAPMWGVMPGKRNVNVAKVRKMQPGDWVFFTGEKKIYFGGTVALMWRNRELAKRLWKADDDGSTWEYMYALSGVRAFDVPMDEVRELLDWKRNRHVMGFIVLSDSESDTLQSLLTLDPANAAITPLDPGTEQAAVDAFDGELERKAQRAARGEQAALKRRLLPGTTGECALCGRELPGTFLIGAHIKKRSMCTDTEKRDLANIAMLACVFGCDALYEHGYVAVAPGGDIQTSPLANDVPEVAAYIQEKLASRTVTWWNEEREPYYDWHRMHTFKAGLPT